LSFSILFSVLSLAEVDQTLMAILIVAIALPQNQEFSGIHQGLSI
jgi:hypothetical protein